MQSGVHPGLFNGGQEHRGPRTRADAVRSPSRAVQRGGRSTGVHGRGLMRSGVQGCSAGGQEHRGPRTRADAVRGPSRAVQRGVRSTGVHGRGLRVQGCSAGGQEHHDEG